MWKLWLSLLQLVDYSTKPSSIHPCNMYIYNTCSLFQNPNDYILDVIGYMLFIQVDIFNSN